MNHNGALGGLAWVIGQAAVDKGDLTSSEHGLGGKAMNIAVAMARLGMSVELITAVGNDPFGTEIRNALRREGVGQSYVVTGGQPQRTVDSVVVEIREARGKRSVKVLNEDPLYDSFGTALVNARRLGQPRPDIIVVTFELPDRALRHFTAASAGSYDYLTGHNRPLLVVQPAPARALSPTKRELLSKAQVIIPNRDEARRILRLGGPIDPRRDVELLRSRFKAELACITLGPVGCVWATPRDRGFERGVSVKAVDAIGASDVFTGVLATSLLGGFDQVQHGIALATVAAGLSVSRASASGAYDTAPTLAELRHLVAKGVDDPQISSAKEAMERL